MTPLEIDTLRPGPELDRLLAEIMGWPIHAERRTGRHLLAHPYRDNDAWMDDPANYPHFVAYGVDGLSLTLLMAPKAHEQDWMPSRDDQDALLIAERYRLAMVPQPGSDGGTRWQVCDISSSSCSSTEIVVRPVEGTIYQDSLLRLAICKAAVATARPRTR